MTGSRRHVTVDAQNLPKLGHRRSCRSLIPAGGAHGRESVQVSEVDWLTRSRDSKCAEPSKTRPLSFEPVTSGVLRM
jgi:hypothetical protein